jgi:hypothetical protein
MIKIDGNVVIKLIDKFKLVTTKEITVKNAVSGNVAYRIFRRVIANSEEEGFDAPTKVRLTTPGGSIIKDITGSYGPKYQQDRSFRRKLTVMDTSTDTYTLGGIYLMTLIGGIVLFRQLGFNITKESYEILLIEWIVSIGAEY